MGGSIIIVDSRSLIFLRCRLTYLPFAYLDPGRCFLARVIFDAGGTNFNQLHFTGLFDDEK